MVVRLSADFLNELLIQLGFGGGAGFIVGFAFKKMMKTILVLIGLFFLALQYLDYVGFIELHYDRLVQAAQGWVSTFQGNLSALTFLTANIPLAGGFAVGFSLGFKKG